MKVEYITDNYFSGGYFSDGSNVYMRKVFDGSYTIGMTGIKNNWFEFFNFIGNFRANTSINNNLFDDSYFFISFCFLRRKWSKSI